MPTARTTANIYTHALNIVRGDRGMVHNLLFTAQKSANVTFSLKEGRCVHLNSEGEFETGASGNQMPLFVLQTESDPDVDQTYSEDDYQVFPAGAITAVVATAGVELSTTEYDTERTYAPNDLLRAPVANTNATTGGRLTNESVVKVASATPASSTCVCGVVSVGEDDHPNAKNEQVLRFWPIFQMGANGL